MLQSSQCPVAQFTLLTEGEDPGVETEPQACLLLCSSLASVSVFFFKEFSFKMIP